MSPHHRLPLLAVVFASLLTVPALLAEQVAAPLPKLAPVVESCPAPAEPVWLAPPPPVDFLLCTCANCRAYPDEICQISPKGYSIECRDYLRINCDK